MLCGLQDYDVAGCDSRPNLPCPHEQREIPWDDLSANADGLMTSISEGEVVGLDHFAVDLIGPSTVVFKTISRHGDIALCDVESFAVVEGFDGSKGLDLTVHQLAESLEKLTTRLGGHGTPGAVVVVVNFAGGLNCNVNILLSCFLDRANDFAVPRI